MLCRSHLSVPDPVHSTGKKGSPMTTNPEHLLFVQRRFAEVSRATHRLKLLMRTVLRDSDGKMIPYHSFSFALSIQSKEDLGPFALYVRSIDELGLPTRARNCFLAEGIYSLGELTERSAAELRNIPNLGRKSVRKIRDALKQRGLSLRPRKRP